MVTEIVKASHAVGARVYALRYNEVNRYQLTANCALPSSLSMSRSAWKNELIPVAYARSRTSAVLMIDSIRKIRLNYTNVCTFCLRVVQFSLCKLPRNNSIVTMKLIDANKRQIVSLSCFACRDRLIPITYIRSCSVL